MTSWKVEIDPNPPVFQKFRDTFEPVDAEESIKYVLTSVDEVYGRIVLWSNIILEFPHARIILHGNHLVPLIRENLTPIEPYRIEANTEVVYVVAMD
ncbi:hypothetical protein BGW39_005184 [Mortierella sp. 14UC]|nr:hypothetical protein BGW39_005184 [Mortierella sp. 14UC]